ncbi:MAG: hypothetical protein U1E65_32760 [Myxococcota bacterium]
MNALKGMAGGGLAGAAVAGLTGLMWGGPFMALPSMVMGGTLGAGAGALAGLFTPNYNQMMSAYNPMMLNYSGMSPFGNFMMPNALMANSYNPFMNSFVPMGGSGFGGGMAAGALAAMFGGAAMSCFSYPMYGLGWGGVWGGHSFGFGGFDWGPNVWKGLGWPLGW